MLVSEDRDRRPPFHCVARHHRQRVCLLLFPAVFILGILSSGTIRTSIVPSFPIALPFVLLPSENPKKAAVNHHLHHDYRQGCVLQDTGKTDNNACHHGYSDPAKNYKLRDIEEPSSGCHYCALWF